MRIIQPFDFSQVTLDDVLASKQLLPVSGNKIWMASIFSNLRDLNNLSFIDKDRQITQLDDTLFNGFTILNNINQDVYINNGKGRKYIKSIEIGDFNDSIKRYTQLDKPIDYNLNANVFLNLPQIDFSLSHQLDVIPKDLIFKPEINIDNFSKRIKPELFEVSINHPHINYPKSLPIPFKHNNKALIESIFKWATTKGIKYIYCINEWRPYSVTTEYTTPYVYYTIKGSY